MKSFCRSFTLRAGCIIIGAISLLCLTLTVVAMSLSQPSPGRTKRVEISVNGSTRVAEYNGIPPSILMVWSSLLSIYAMCVVIMMYGTVKGRPFLLVPWLMINALTTVGALSIFVFTCCFDLDPERLQNSAAALVLFLWFEHVVYSHYHQLTVKQTFAETVDVVEKAEP